MLFFFELFLFVLVILTLALGEFVGRWLALVLWLVVTVFALVGYVLVRQSLGGLLVGGSRQPDGESSEPVGGSPEVGTDEPRPAPLDEKWARTLLYNWRRSNVLLVTGAVVVVGWYWLAG